MNSLTLQLLRVHGYDEPLHVGESEEDDCGGDGRPLGGVPQRQDPLRVHHQRLGERVLGGRSARFKLDLRVFGSAVLLLTNRGASAAPEVKNNKRSAKEAHNGDMTRTMTRTRNRGRGQRGQRGQRGCATKRITQ